MVKKTVIKPFSSNTGTSQTDRQTRWTELLYQYCTSMCWSAI